MSARKRLPLLAREHQHRRVVRYPIEFAAELREDARTLVGKTVDLNANGVLLELSEDASLESVALVDLALSIPGVEGPVVLPGRVIRVDGRRVALAFDDPPEVVRDCFATLVIEAFPSSVQAARLRTLPRTEPSAPTTGKLSVVVPMFNEEAVAEHFNTVLQAELEKLGVAYEIIYIDDGSSDGTLAVLERLSAESPKVVRAVSLSRNFGHQAAVFAGLQNSNGVAVVTMDGDLQHPPSLIRELVAHWKQGVDVVHTVRERSEKQGWFKRTTSRWFYALFASLSSVSLPSGTADFRLLDRYVVDVIVALPERSPFLRGLARWIGFRDAFVPYHAPERAGGTSKFTVRKMATLALDGIMAFSSAPLRLAFVLASMAVVFVAALVIIIAHAFITHQQVQGWASLMLAIALGAGAQLFVLGIIAEYVGRILAETKARPRYLVGTTLGFEDPVFEALLELRPKLVP